MVKELYHNMLEIPVKMPAVTPDMKRMALQCIPAIDSDDIPGIIEASEDPLSIGGWTDILGEYEDEALDALYSLSYRLLKECNPNPYAAGTEEYAAYEDVSSDWDEITDLMIDIQWGQFAPSVPDVIAHITN